MILVREDFTEMVLVWFIPEGKKMLFNDGPLNAERGVSISGGSFRSRQCLY
jgi:hypothetical protein